MRICDEPSEKYGLFCDKFTTKSRDKFWFLTQFIGACGFRDGVAVCGVFFCGENRVCSAKIFGVNFLKPHCNAANVKSDLFCEFLCSKFKTIPRFKFCGEFAACLWAKFKVCIRTNLTDRMPPSAKFVVDFLGACGKISTLFSSKLGAGI